MKTDLPATEGLGPLRYQTKEFADKFWALIIFEDVDRFAAFELIRAKNLEQARAQTFLFASWLVNPALFSSFDRSAFVQADVQNSLELLFESVPLGQDEN